MSTKHKIPQMFYLRKLWVTVQVSSGERLMRMLKPVYVYWSYRDSTPRIIDTVSRDAAKKAIITGKLTIGKKKTIQVCIPHPEADFFR